MCKVDCVRFQLRRASGSRKYRVATDDSYNEVAGSVPAPMASGEGAVKKSNADAIRHAAQ